ncbi:uncharacterized protein DS421_15g502100 [Arachis hypogaea]|nr:uncharacterized protein DS421_15g502100 [Arachis hypogaea]
MRVLYSPFDIYVSENQQILPHIVRKIFGCLFFSLRSLDNFHKHKFHFLQVQKFFRKIIHLFQAY